MYVVYNIGHIPHLLNAFKKYIFTYKYLIIIISVLVWIELMSALNDYFNVKDYFNQQSTQLNIILEFLYIEGLL